MKLKNKVSLIKFLVNELINPKTTKTTLNTTNNTNKITNKKTTVNPRKGSVVVPIKKVILPRKLVLILQLLPKIQLKMMVKIINLINPQ